MSKKFSDLTRRTKLVLIAPVAILAMTIFALIGGEVVMLLWNWLAPALFGLRQVTFWQALGLLALCRILFGGFGLAGGSPRAGVRRRMRERWEQLTPEEREAFRRALEDRGRTSPLESAPSA